MRAYARLYIRTKCDLPIQVTFERDSKQVMLPTRCTNLCIGGFFADLPQPIEIGQKMLVEFLDENSGTLRVEAEVRHVQCTETGFQFLDQSEASKQALSEFLNKKSSNSGV
jgi:hypothetical protein